MTMPESPAHTDAPFRIGPADDPTEIRQLLAAGYLRRVVGDVLIPSDVPETLPLRSRSALLLLSPRLRDAEAVVAFSSAAWVLCGWRIGQAPPGSLEVVVPPRSSRAAVPHVRVRQVTLGPRDLMELSDGCRVTTPERTAADVARDLPEPVAEAALNALHTSLGVEPEGVLHVLRTMSGARGVIRAQQLVREWADGTLAPVG